MSTQHLRCLSVTIVSVISSSSFIYCRLRHHHHHLSSSFIIIIYHHHLSSSFIIIVVVVVIAAVVITIIIIIVLFLRILDNLISFVILFQTHNTTLEKLKYSCDEWATLLARALFTVCTDQHVPSATGSGCREDNSPPSFRSVESLQMCPRAPPSGDNLQQSRPLAGSVYVLQVADFHFTFRIQSSSS